MKDKKIDFTALVNHPVYFICIILVAEHLRSLHARCYCQTLTQNIIYKLYSTYMVLRRVSWVSRKISFRVHDVFDSRAKLGVYYKNRIFITDHYIECVTYRRLILGSIKMILWRPKNKSANITFSNLNSCE